MEGVERFAAHSLFYVAKHNNVTKLLKINPHESILEKFI